VQCIAVSFFSPTYLPTYQTPFPKCPNISPLPPTLLLLTYLPTYLLTYSLTHHPYSRPPPRLRHPLRIPRQLDLARVPHRLSLPRRMGQFRHRLFESTSIWHEQDVAALLFFWRHDAGVWREWRSGGVEGGELCG
jgi:hypothetical protein